MAKKTNGTGNAQTPSSSDEGWSAPLPPPVLIDGFWKMEEGETIQGVVQGIGETKFGEYLAIRVAAPVTITVDGEYVESKPGAVVGVSMRAGMRGLTDVIKAGPTAVRIKCNGKSGKAWDLEVRHRPAF